MAGKTQVVLHVDIYKMCCKQFHFTSSIYWSVLIAMIVVQHCVVPCTEGEQSLCWRFDDELWTRFRNVTFIQLCIFCFFDRKSGQYVSKHHHFKMVWYVKGISAKNLASKRDISVFFVIIHQQQKIRFLHVHLSVNPVRKRVCPCSETCWWSISMQWKGQR